MSSVRGSGGSPIHRDPLAVLASGRRTLQNSATPPKQEIQFATRTSRGRRPLPPLPPLPHPHPRRLSFRAAGERPLGAARAQSLGRPGSRNGLRVPFPLGVTPEAQTAWQQDGFSGDWLGTEAASPAHFKALLACDSGAKGHPSRPPFSLLFFWNCSPFPRPVPSGLTLKLRAYCLPGTVFRAVLYLKSHQFL